MTMVEARPEAQSRTQSDLIERLKAAACEAIDNERQGLEYEPKRLRSVVLELELNGGAVRVANAYIQRRGKL